MKLHCNYEACRRPWARFVNGTLVVESRHNGSTHQNVIAVTVLYEVLLASKLPDHGWGLYSNADHTVAHVEPASIVMLPVFSKPLDGLELTCMHCTLPWAYAVNGLLMVQSDHDGEKHINQIAAATLLSIFGKRYDLKDRG